MPLWPWSPKNDKRKDTKPKPAGPKAPKQKGPKIGDPAKPGLNAQKQALKPKDLVDPKVVKDEKTQQEQPYAYKKNDRGAKLYGPNGIQSSDVRQGSIGDCFLAAAMASVASAKPDAIRNAIKDNGDNTFTVRFYQVGWDGSKTAQYVTVDGDLPWKADLDMPAYAKSTEKVDGKEHLELWPSILEKAYAQWKGSYDEIGHGGSSGDVMTAITGDRSSSANTSGPGQNDPLWERMKKASADKKPMTAGTGGEEDPRYKDPKAGVYGWHAYSVLGVEEKASGPGGANAGKPVRTVTMRNPWSKRRRDADAAAAGDQSNATAGGVFQLSWEEFRRLYDDVTITG